MSFAIVRVGGKQLKISTGDKIEILGIPNPEVLLFSNGDNVEFGDPVLSKYSVTLKLVEEKRTKKVRVARFKSKSRYRRVKGHRQPIGLYEVVSISDGTKKEIKKEAVKAKEPAEKKSIKKVVEKKEVKKEAPKKRGRPKKEASK